MICLSPKKEGFCWQVEDEIDDCNVGAGLKLLNHLQVGANYNIPLGNTADIEGTNASYKTKTWQVSVAYIF